MSWCCRERNFYHSMRGLLPRGVIVSSFFSVCTYTYISLCLFAWVLNYITLDYHRITLNKSCTRDPDLLDVMCVCVRISMKLRARLNSNNTRASFFFYIPLHRASKIVAYLIFNALLSAGKEIFVRLKRKICTLQWKTFFLSV